MSVEAMTLLASRRSVLSRHLTEPGPSAEELERILEIGLRVPDHCKLEPWRIQIVNDESLLMLRSIIGHVYAADNPDADADAVAEMGLKHARGPLMLVVSCHPKQDKFDKAPLVEQQLSCGAVCMNLLTAATASGYGAQWLTGWPAYHPRISEALGIAQPSHVVGFIHIGSVETAPKERPRPRLGAIVSRWSP